MGVTLPTTECNMESNKCGPRHAAFLHHTSAAPSGPTRWRRQGHGERGRERERGDGAGAADRYHTGQGMPTDMTIDMALRLSREACGAEVARLSLGGRRARRRCHGIMSRSRLLPAFHAFPMATEENVAQAVGSGGRYTFCRSADHHILDQLGGNWPGK